MRNVNFPPINHIGQLIFMIERDIPAFIEELYLLLTKIDDKNTYNNNIL